MEQEPSRKTEKDLYVLGGLILKRTFLTSVCLCLLLTLFTAVPAIAAETNETEAFSCYTFDGQNHVINGFWSDRDGIWYLFVTSSQDVSETNLYYTGTICETSAGVLDTEAGMVQGAFQERGDGVKLTGEDGAVYPVVVLQSDLPSVYIDLKNTTLDAIHADKDQKHKKNSIYITDPNGTYDLTVEDSLEIKGRGNSTWREYEKKAYQIKFDEKTSVLGMGEAKKWVLLANASDDSMIRTQLVYQTAKQLDMGFVCSLEYVDLWIEGEYRGTFLLGDKVEPGSSRLQLSNDAGALFEQDEAFYQEEDYWFYSDLLDRHFVLKEIVEEEETIIADAMADFDASVDNLVQYLYDTPSEEVSLNKLSTMIDVDSFAKYYLINEYVLNKEAFNTSFYWYKDGPDDVIHLGPLWDFDTCMGNDNSRYTESFGYNHPLFHYLLAAPEFYQYTMEIAETYHEELNEMPNLAKTLQNQIADSARMNYIRWDVLGDPNPKGGADFYPTFDEAVKAVQSWLQNRDVFFEVTKNTTVTSTISEDCYDMTIHFSDGHVYDKMEFVVWSLDNGRDDLTWYDGKQNKTGDWQCTVDLSNHNSAGLYRILVYTNGSRTDVTAHGYNYVEVARTNRYPLELTIGDKPNILKAVVQNSKKFNEVAFAMWSAENAQDDLQWYDAEKNADGFWQCNIDLNNHKTNGRVYLYVYKKTGGTPELITSEMFYPAQLQIQNDNVDGSLFRLYNPNSGEHLYTGSAEEGMNLVEAGWIYEGVAWKIPAEGLPIHRVYNPNAGDHHYTGSMEEVNNLVSYGWLYEGVAWNTPVKGVMVYRLYNPNAFTGAHHYTPSDEERDYLVSLGWQYEGVAWNGAK